MTGLYELTVAGANGGGGNASSGIIVRGRKVLTEGDVLKILVGQAGVVGQIRSNDTTSALNALSISGVIEGRVRLIAKVKSSPLTSGVLPSD